MALLPVNEKAVWITPIESWPDDFNRIFMFFVVHSPVFDQSSRCISLLDYGWTTPWRKPYSLRIQLNRVSNSKNLLFSASKYDLMDRELEKADLLEFPPTDLSSERACFYNGKRAQYISLFYHIRNSLAHGRFNIIEDRIIMEDVSPRRKEMAPGTKVCSARMVLRINTLIKWIELIEGGEVVYSANKNHGK